MYHYQEWSEGLHNYNSHIILTLQLCMLLQSLIQVFVVYEIREKKFCFQCSMIITPQFLYVSRITVLRIACQ